MPLPLRWDQRHVTKVVLLRSDDAGLTWEPVLDPTPIGGEGGGPSSTVALDAATLAALETISVANFPATQPVSGPLTDSQLRASAVPVSGPLTDAQLRAAAVPATLPSATLAVTATGAAAAAVTLTLPAPGAGLFQHITALELTLYSTAARTGVAAPIVVTTTNLPGSPAFTFGTAAAIGSVDRHLPPMAHALRSAAANVAVTIVAPAVTGGIWRINASYFVA